MGEVPFYCLKFKELSKHGFNQTRIQKENLLPRQTITNIKAGKNITLETLNKICVMCGLQPVKQSLDESKYLNSKLDELNKVVYLVIDDLDRCDVEYQSKMFKVIRESMELHNCKMIFLVDKTKFLTEKQDTE